MNKIDYRIISWLGVLGVILRKQNPWFLLLCIFFIFGFFPNPKNKDKENLKEFYKTDLLSNFNPYILRQIILQIIGEIYLRIFDNKIEVSQNTYGLPFNGSWTAVNGGNTKETSHSWELLTQRFAYDFVILDKNKLSFNEQTENINSYYCYNKEIVSVQKGVVVKVVDNIDDYEKVGNYSLDWKTKNIIGNHIIIKHSNGEYSLYAHLKNQSIKVKKGDNVEKGELLAYCGNSGRSTEPHLHFQIMKNPNFFFAKSLKIKFGNIYDSNENEIEFVEKNNIVKNK